MGDAQPRERGAAVEAVPLHQEGRRQHLAPGAQGRAGAVEREGAGGEAGEGEEAVHVPQQRAAAAGGRGGGGEALDCDAAGVEADGVVGRDGRRRRRGAMARARWAKPVRPVSTRISRLL